MRGTTLESATAQRRAMNLFLVPMWMLSGALFPASGASGWVAALMWINPLTYGVSALRHTIYGHASAGEPSLTVSLLVVGVFGGALLGLGAWSVRGDRSAP